ncbi:hypothetical protein Efla_006218 [Eimeria flavescens]
MDLTGVQQVAQDGKSETLDFTGIQTAGGEGLFANLSVSKKRGEVHNVARALSTDSDSLDLSPRSICSGQWDESDYFASGESDEAASLGGSSPPEAKRMRLRTEDELAVGVLKADAAMDNLQGLLTLHAEAPLGPEGHELVGVEPQLSQRTQDELDAGTALIAMKDGSLAACEPTTNQAESTADVLDPVAHSASADSHEKALTVETSSTSSSTKYRLRPRPILPRPDQSRLNFFVSRSPLSGIGNDSWGGRAEAAGGTSDSPVKDHTDPSSEPDLLTPGQSVWAQNDSVFLQSGFTSPSCRGTVGNSYNQHLFFRIPRTDPSDQAKQRFSPFIATSAHVAQRRYSLRLYPLRALLVKEFLSAKELDEVVENVHYLVAGAWHFEDQKVCKPHTTRTVRELGRRYLVMDAVLAGLQVLGESTTRPWWRELAKRVNADNLDAKPITARTPEALLNAALSHKLCAAINILKTGARLSAEETVKLKRMLFCSPLSPSIFKLAQWDVWRRDDQRFWQPLLAESTKN